MMLRSGARSVFALIAFAFAASGLFAGGPRGQAAVPGFALVRDGRPACVIALPPGASAADRRAAEILRESVRRMTGAELPIVDKAKPVPDGEIWIGYGLGVYPDSFRPAAARLKPGGYLDVVSNRAVYILSGGGKGSIYGVVHLLEKYFGCRKYSPTADFFPVSASLALGRVFDLDNPANDFRCVNGDFVQDPDYRDWLRLDGTEEMFAKGYYVHTFNRLLPWAEFFADHPDYYALMNGKRIIDQLCPSRPEVFDLLADRLAKEMAAQPDQKVWSVSQNDNSSYCRCPDCLKIIAEEGTPAGPILRLVNRLAARFPDKIISTLAYQFSRPAPRVTKPAANVQIMLCTIELNRSLPIAEDPSSASFVRDIEDWSRLTKNLYLWDYTVDFAHQVSPFPNLHVLQPNLRFFARNGARQHFQQTNTSPGHEFSELKGWILAKLLWNPDLDVDAAINDFLAGYYGTAAPFIRHIIDSYREALAVSGAKLDIYEPPNAHAEGFLSAERVAVYDAVFDLAEKAVAADPERLRRVRAARLPLQYAELEIGKADMFGPRGFYAEDQGRFEPRPEKGRLLDAFFTACLDAGVRSLNESGLAPKAYYDAVRRFIDVQVEGNLAFRRKVEADPAPAAKYGRGDLALLTNGVRGAGDYKVHWLGWEAADFSLRLDLGEVRRVRSIALSTLYDPKSWIFHPRRVTCEASADGAEWRPIGVTEIDGDQRSEALIRNFEWIVDLAGVRFIRFRVEGTKANPSWHPSAGGASWVFVDEIVVR
ncbi:MAG: DUF4838 domain-containing protein [Candidatus Aminicenantes bacterium]|nr:DUF4838 domain-containing protein [Candidatus Aminicenantes bacterium]